MKKILTTTALASALLVTANASFAQTTVTGQLDIGYQALSGKGATTLGKEASFRTFTRETQINVANKGKLSNGLDYAAGFSWEVDGGESIAADGAFSENVYLDFIMGGTTLTISADHIQNPNFEITNLAGGVADIDDLVQGHGASTTNRSLAAIHGTSTANSASQAHGIGIIQNLGVATASFYYAPDRATGGAAANDAGANTLRDLGQSQMEIMVRGDLGVKGLNAFVYRGTADTDTPGTTASNKDVEGFKYGASYNFGKISAAASQSKVESATGMTGYQETLTDPSYYQQIVIQTAPHIGNTGINDEDDESSRIWVSGYVVRDPSRIASNWRSKRSLEQELKNQNIISIAGIDTRALTRHLRDKGAMRAGIFSKDISAHDSEFFINKVKNSPQMKGADLCGMVSTKESFVLPAIGKKLYQVAAIDLCFSENFGMCLTNCYSPTKTLLH